MHLTATLQLCQPSLRHVRPPRPVKALSTAGSAYLGRRFDSRQLLGALFREAGISLLPRRSSGAGAAQPVRASFLGVGAPEALLVGVVALLVFGPKGLAQAAKSLGATLRAFAPTLREITSVSQELKSSLEQEIGINEIKEELSRPAVPAPRPPRTDAEPAVAAAAVGASSSDGTAAPSAQQGTALSELAESMQQQGQRLDTGMAAMIDPDIERKRAEAAAAAWGGALPAAAAPSAVPAAAAVAGAAAAAPAAAQAQQQAAPAPAPAAAAVAPQASPPAAAPRAVEAMSLEELEAELTRRKAAVAKGQLPKTLSADD